MEALKVPVDTTRLWRDAGVQPLATESSHSWPIKAFGALNKRVKIAAVVSIESDILAD